MNHLLKKALEKDSRRNDAHRATMGLRKEAAVPQSTKPPAIPNGWTVPPRKKNECRWYAFATPIDGQAFGIITPEECNTGDIVFVHKSDPYNPTSEHKLGELQFIVGDGRKVFLKNNS